MENINPSLSTRPVADLHEDPRNARRHNPRNMEAIKNSLRDLGQQKPIVVDGKGKIIAGNGTYRAALSLGWGNIAAVVFTGDATAARKFAIADNRTAELADWDVGILQDEMHELGEVNWEATGWTVDELRDTTGQLPSSAAPSGDGAGDGGGSTLTHADGDIGKTPSDKLDTFMNNTLRQITLIYSAEKHALAVAALEAVCKDQGLATNADAVDWLLEQYSAARAGGA